MKTPVKIYYLCVHNRCRSQIAEAFTRYYGGSSVVVASAAVDKAESIHPITIEVMKEIGIDISKNEAKKVDMKVIMSSNIVIKLCKQAEEKCPVVPFGIRNEQWDIGDPFHGSFTIEDFRRVRDEIHEKVKLLLDEIGAFELKSELV